jgi:hypothetical protein
MERPHARTIPESFIRLDEPALSPYLVEMRERNLISIQVLSEAGTDDPMDLTRLGVEAARSGRFERGLLLLAEAYRVFSAAHSARIEALAASPEDDEPDAREARRLAPAATFSYYGLCLARTAPTRAAEAASFCEIAIQKDPLGSEHYINLARVWQAGHNRRRTVEALDRGLAELPKSAPLIALRREVGIRGIPPLRFLPRENPLNATLGKIIRWQPKG